MLFFDFYSERHVYSERHLFVVVVFAFYDFCVKGVQIANGQNNRCLLESLFYQKYVVVGDGRPCLQFGFATDLFGQVVKHLRIVLASSVD